MASSASALGAHSVTLAWDPNPETSVAGYVLHYGVASGNYIWASDVGDVTLSMVDQLESGRTYYFVVGAYNNSGFEGAPSNEVSYSAPEDPPDPDPPDPDPPPLPPMDPPPTNSIPIVLHTLTALTEDGSGVPLQIQPSDEDGLAAGWTPLVRSYVEHSLVTVTAPRVFEGKAFMSWILNGEQRISNPSILMQVEGDIELRAAYINNELVARWSFDEREGLQAKDSSGNQHHAQLEKGTAWTAGVLHGGALGFDGYNDLVRVPDDDQLEFAGRNFTVTLWFRTTRWTSQALIEKRHDSAYGLFLLALNRHPAVAGAFSVYTGNAWIDSTFRGAPDGAWHHVAVSYDGSSFTLYRDGEIDSVFATTAAYEATPYDLYFGQTSSKPGGWTLEGQLDEVRLYHRALSPAEIAELIDSQAQSLFLLDVVSHPSNGLIHLVVYSPDGEEITPLQMDHVDVLVSDDLQQPASEWSPLLNRPQWSNGIGLWIDPESLIHPQRFYLLRERP